MLTFFFRHQSPVALICQSSCGTSHLTSVSRRCMATTTMYPQSPSCPLETTSSVPPETRPSRCGRLLQGEGIVTKIVYQVDDYMWSIISYDWKDKLLSYMFKVIQVWWNILSLKRKKKIKSAQGIDIKSLSTVCVILADIAWRLSQATGSGWGWYGCVVMAPLLLPAPMTRQCACG